MKAALLAAALMVVISCGRGGTTASHHAVAPRHQGALAAGQGDRTAGRAGANAGRVSGRRRSTKARLTGGATFKSSGQVSWGMECRRQTAWPGAGFHADKLNQGDWTITFTNKASNNFSATFSRKSNSNVQGTLGPEQVRVTRISMSLVSPA
jgi:hypothetical protein